MVKDTFVIIAKKIEPMNSLGKILYKRLLKKAHRDSPINDTLTFSEVSQEFGSFFRLPKEMHFSLLKMMELQGLLEVMPYHHIRLLGVDINEG